MILTWRKTDKGYAGVDANGIERVFIHRCDAAYESWNVVIEHNAVRNMTGGVDTLASAKAIAPLLVSALAQGLDR